MKKICLYTHQHATLVTWIIFLPILVFLCSLYLQFYFNSVVLFERSVYEALEFLKLIIHYNFIVVCSQIRPYFINDNFYSFFFNLILSGMLPLNLFRDYVYFKHIFETLVEFDPTSASFKLDVKGCNILF